MKNKRTKTTIWITLMLVFCFGAVPFAKADTLKLISLKCYTPEDSETDEAKFYVTIDNALNWSSARKNMRAGDVWDFNQYYGRDLTFRFTNKVHIILYDIDDGRNSIIDSDDYLGALTVDNTTLRNRTLTKIFNGDGAHYELRYRVTP